MSRALPKEMQTAYQRWELASFDEPIHAPEPEPETEPEIEVAPEPPRLSEEAQAQLHAEAEALRNEAWQSGYADGLEAGRSLGLTEGRAQAAGELLRLQQICETFSADVAHANETIAHDLLDLALDFAKAMLKTSLQVNHELVLPIVGEAVRYLPSLQEPLLFLNPADVQLVKEHMGEELTQAGWRIAEDTHLEAGGCRIETVSNQIDASLAGRWERLAASLGKDVGWLKK